MQEQIRYALDLFTSMDNVIHPDMVSPFTLEGRIYASNAILFLSMPERDELKVFEQGGTRVPRADAILRPPFPTSWDIVDNDTLATDQVICSILGLPVNGFHLQTIHLFGRVAGLKYWEVAKYRDNQVIFHCYYGEDDVYILLMGLHPSMAKEVTHLISPVSNRDVTCCDAIDWEKGADSFAKMQEARLKEDNEEEDGSFHVFEVTLVKYATVAVRAKDADEAMKIAVRKADYRIFEDSDMEADSWNDSDSDSASRHYDYYLDENGKHKWEEEEDD